MKALIDTNIIIDAITMRDETSHLSAKVIELCTDNRIAGYVAPHSFGNMYYVLRKDYSDEERRILIREYCKILDVVPLNENIVLSASNNNDITDFEDAVQYACAEAIGADCIITRNVDDYSKTMITVLTPQEVISLFS